MKKKSRGKKLLLALIALVLVAAIGAGIWFGTQSSAETVGVYPFEYLGMTEYWGDSQESYGPVSTDRIQTVFLSDTQSVTEILVKQGDMVKKGDTLMTFDTTLSDIQLERKRLEVEKLKLQLEEAEKTLKKIRQMVPMEPADMEIVIPDAPVFLGEEMTESYRVYLDKAAGYDGTTKGSAFICRIREDTYVDDALLETLRRMVWGTEGICEHDKWAQECGLCNLCPHGQPEDVCTVCNCSHGPDCEVCTKPRCVHDSIAELCALCKTCIHGRVFSDCALCCSVLCEHGIPSGYCNICSPKVCVHGENCPVCYCIHGESPAQCPDCNAPESGTPEPDPVSAGEEDGWFVRFLSNTEGEPPLAEPVPDPAPSVFSYYVIFKSTRDDMSLGDLTAWQGVQVVGRMEDFSLSFFDPMTMDYSRPEVEEEETAPPEYDFSVGYTAEQLLEMRRDQEQKIKDLKFKIRVADNGYKLMRKEVNDGNIRAEFDGEVVTVLTEDEAKNLRQPIVKVSGGGGFYIEGSVSELERENLRIGQEVSVNDWNTGSVYTGKIDSIGDFPTGNNGWNGMGNPNATYFPFMVFVEGDANLQAGGYVSIQYAAAESNHGIYLEKAFLRTEKGESFVYVLGKDDRLEKRTVTTGKSLWGSYMEILSGLTPEDKIAFPYGKDVKEGAKAEEKDLSSLYGY